MACGENPKRVYGSKDKFPSTRMGNVAGYRAQWIEAQEYIRDQAGVRDEGGGGRRGCRARQARCAARHARRRAQGRDHRAPALLPRRRDGDRARHGGRVRLPRVCVSSRGRGLQDREPARGAGRVRGDVGRLVGFQDGGVRRHRGEHRDGRRGTRRVRHRALRFGGGHTAPQPGGRQGDGARSERRASRFRRSGRSPGSRPTRRSPSGSSSARERSSRERWRTWCCGTRTRSACTRSPTRCYIDGALRYDRAHPPAAPDSDFSLGQAATAVGARP